MQPTIVQNLIPASVNDWTEGRQGHSIKYIVLHTADASVESATNTFMDDARAASAHKIVGLNGTITQYVLDANTAWHAANWPVNLQSLGLEHEDNANPNDAVRTDAMYASSAWQVAQWCKENGIPCKRGVVDPTTHMPTEPGIYLHSEVSEQGTSCPDGLDWNRIITQAQAYMASPTAASPEGSYSVLVDVPGYTTAALASSRTNPTATVKPGNYYVYNQADGMVNVTVKVGEPGSWINPADNKLPASATPPSAANYDGNAVTIQPGWGLSNAAQAAGYPDFNSPLRWTAIAALNGSDDWQTFNSQLKIGQRIVVGKYSAPGTTAAAANPPAPTPPAASTPDVPTNTVYSKLDEPLNLVANKQPTHVWMLGFAAYTDARAAFDMAQGAAFVAYGKAQRTDLDKPVYYMTESDFANADTTGTPMNNRGINTVDLSPAPAAVPAAQPSVTPPAGAQVPVTAIPNFDTRFNYVPFVEPQWFVAPQAVSAINDLRRVDYPNGSADYPYDSVSLQAGQPVQVAGTMQVGDQKFYRTTGSVTTNMYYGIPAGSIKSMTGSNVILKVAASVSGFVVKLFGKGSAQK